MQAAGAEESSGNNSAGVSEPRRKPTQLLPSAGLGNPQLCFLSLQGQRDRVFSEFYSWGIGGRATVRTTESVLARQRARLTCRASKLEVSQVFRDICFPSPIIL